MDHIYTVHELCSIVSSQRVLFEHVSHKVQLITKGSGALLLSGNVILMDFHLEMDGKQIIVDTDWEFWHRLTSFKEFPCICRRHA